MVHTNDQRLKAAKYTGYAMCAVLALLAIYFGSYLCLLERKVYWPDGVDPATGNNRFYIEPKYRFDSDRLPFAMLPAHRVDRRLRETFWTTIDHSDGRRWKNPTPPSSSEP